MQPFPSSPNPAPKSSNHPLAYPSSAHGAAPATDLAASVPSSEAQEAAPTSKVPPFPANAAQCADPELDHRSDNEGEAIEMDSLWSGADWAAAWPRKSRPGAGGGVMLEGFVDCDGEFDDGASVGRTKSLTDDDLEELKGCLDLGFGFCYDEIPELCSTLPALELCYSMSRSLELSGEGTELCLAKPTPTAVASIPVASWKIFSPGDDPEDVKARLKYWAQAVACTVKLCN